MGSARMGSSGYAAISGGGASESLVPCQNATLAATSATAALRSKVKNLGVELARQMNCGTGSHHEGYTKSEGASQIPDTIC